MKTPPCDTVLSPGSASSAPANLSAEIRTDIHHFHAEL